MAERQQLVSRFPEQIQFLLGKTNVPTQSWVDVWQSAHDSSFMVAGANKAELVADFRAAVQKAVLEKRSLADFRKDFDSIVTKHGWSYNGSPGWRSRVIYETNMRASYQAGRHAQLTDPAFLAANPYWRYKHSDIVIHPRREHLAWNGLVIRADDPWWQSHYPPNGWGCKCTVFPESDRSLARKRIVPQAAPPIEYVTRTVGQRSANPRTVEVPKGIDPGWGYAPGATSSPRVRDAVLKRADDLPAPLAGQLRFDVDHLPPAPAAPKQLALPLSGGAAVPPPQKRDEVSQRHFSGRGIKVMVDGAEVTGAAAKRYHELVGAPDYSTVRVATQSFGGAGGFEVSIKHPLVEVGERKVHLGGREIYNAHLRISDKAPPQFGTRMVALEAIAASKQGFKTLAASAHRGGSYFGYAHWPRMGFDAPLPGRFRDRLPAELQGAKTLLDLYETAAGQQWWRENGDTIAVTFDLAPGSRSFKVLYAYLRSKGVQL